MSATVIDRAPGKLVLLGEYAVLRGAPALVLAVGREVQVKLRPDAEGAEGDRAVRLVFTCPEIRVQDAEVAIGTDSWELSKARWPSPLIQSIVAAAVQWCGSRGRSLRSAHITIDSSSFYRDGQKLGLGSSAAVTVALLRSLLRSLGSEPPASELFALAKGAHSRAQGGAGSGVDIAASTYGGVLEYRIDQSPRPTHLPPRVECLAVWTGHSSSTPDLVRQVLQAVEARPGARAVFGELSEAAEQGALDARRGDADAFLDTVGRFADAYRRLGEECGVPLFDTAHDAIASAGTKAGAVYKPSGAGAGDLGVAFGRDESIETLRRSLPRGAVALDLGSQL